VKFRHKPKKDKRPDLPTMEELHREAHEWLMRQLAGNGEPN